MTVAIFGRNFLPNFYPYISIIFEKLENNDTKIIIYKPFYRFILKTLKNFSPKIKEILKKNVCHFFESHEDLKFQDIQFMMSIGGDGTFLEAVSFVRNYDIALVGINCGRLGFLATISKDNINSALDAILANHYIYEERTLIKLETNKQTLFEDFSFALNEFTVHKKDSASMITIHAYLNNEFLNSYWADGLIISTPTGSTAYSLSSGGPIVLPSSNNFIISPISPHNLTVRPIVIPDNYEINLKVEGRSLNYLASLDSRSASFTYSLEIKLKKADFKIKIIKLKDNSYFSTLRNKLMWGLDSRN